MDCILNKEENSMMEKGFYLVLIVHLLGLGFMMSEGFVLVGLANSSKYKQCSLQNEISLEDTEDIVITLTNNSNEIVDIKEHDLLCRVCYKKIIILIIKCR